DNHGQVLGVRRKLMPTFVERAVWGCGDGSDLLSFDTEFGRIGGLICGENLMTLARAHLIAQGEDFHVAVFPGAFALHTGPKLEEFDASAASFWGYSSCRAHAFEAGAFVIGSCGYITQEDIPGDFALRDTLNVDYARGGSAIYAPIGIPLAPPTPGDAIVYAVCPAEFVKIAKAVVDTVGHYARPDLFALTVTAPAHQRLVKRRAVESIPAGELLRIADRHEVRVADIEASVTATG
ncbi:MAG TPA: nitrilase-related carbon-nitrogen hydrolase, partial [Caldimonas sp.]|nr:nitrilase-related carbon-nitrogen hydrolase [Caldimonas sp.]